MKTPLNPAFLEKKIAHRGLHTPEIAENSMKAFQRAIAYGYAIEIDVHLLTDGKLAVVHDSLLTRLAGKQVRVEDLSSADLANYPLLTDGQTIPLFKDVLELIDGKVPLLVELKFENDFDPRQADAVLSELKDYPNKKWVALQSFHPKAVRYLKQRTNEYAVGILSSYKLNRNWLQKTFFKKLWLFRYMHPDFISYDIVYLPNPYVSHWQKKGVPVLTWTVNSKEKEQKAAQVADNIIFEGIIPDEH